MSDELDYPVWKTRKLARRILLYAAYIDCGCVGGVHGNDANCARADFFKLAREMVRRTDGNPLRTRGSARGPQRKRESTR